VHLVLIRLHGRRSKHVCSCRVVSPMLGAEASLLKTSEVHGIGRLLILLALSNHALKLARDIGVVHGRLHHGVPVEPRLYLLLGIHVGEIRWYERLRLIGLRVVESGTRGIHALRVKTERLLNLLNCGLLTLTMGEGLSSREVLHLDNKVSTRNYERFGSQQASTWPKQ
jgi:hypothetical protein